MKPRSLGFTPARLTLAREAQGLSMTDLARLLSLTPATISGYEAGSRTPAPDIVDELAKHLHQPVPFFSLKAPAAASGPVFYRSLSSATKSARTKAEARMTMLWDAVDYITGFVQLPPVNMPSVGMMPNHPTLITEAMIEGAVAIARKHWKMGDNPAPNLVWLLEESGAIVVRHDLGTDKLDAFSRWRPADQRPYFMLNTARRNAFRSRADAAHEIGHMLLHRYVPAALLNDAAMFKLIEDQAWKFAQAFLLPETPFMRDVYSLNLDALRSLKPKWKVSIAFMLHRIHNLGVLDDDKYTNYRKYLAQRGWLRIEPYDTETEPEQPLLLSQALEFIVESDVQTPDQIASVLAIDPELLEELTLTPKGFFIKTQRRNPFNLQLNDINKGVG